MVPVELCRYPFRALLECPFDPLLMFSFIGWVDSR
jgi:hypothetical protein